MLNVVAPESGTVDAPPERLVSLKLPSGLVIVHDTTPLVFQKTEVREPSGTRAGTAQISASAEGAAVGGGAGGGGVTAFVALFVAVGEGVGAGGFAFGAPTGYPRHAHKLSKNEGGMMNETTELAHGLLRHMLAAIPCGCPPKVSPP